MFVFRSSSALTEYFEDCGTDYVHDSLTSMYWVADRLRDILQGRVSGANMVPVTFVAVIWGA